MTPYGQGCLEVSKYPDRPYRHRFSLFFIVFKQMLRWFPSSKLLPRASHAVLPLKLIRIKPLYSHRPNSFSKLCNLTLVQKIKIPRPLLQSNSSNNSRVFTIIPPLSERWVDESWESPNKIIRLFPRNKLSLTSPMSFHFQLLFCYTCTPVSCSLAPTTSAAEDYVAIIFRSEE
jgi:hypothetical protein